MADKLRIDKWLWHGRFFKTRSLAAAMVASGVVRVNGTRTQKRSHMVVPGDVLTFPQGDDIRVIRIEALGSRRGPAPEAQALYTDLSPPERRVRDVTPKNPAFEGKGRPTKKDRRTLDLSRARSLE
ncbi:RNA-binding S4 domain-containing protein [Roseobacter litoralis]|uniref:RNA-binding S4 domain-containing protein n=1 Tax=Roseobacter litoralis TaxID=42443 RepID=UPI0024932A6D|nr:RNA-binding S4 domain-containing protein [Roseobacter litoralis]